MGEEYRAKVFKSGNSLALRLPKGLGLQEGTEMLLREEQGRYIVEPADAPKRKFNIQKVWGSGESLDLPLIRDQDRMFEPSPRPWDDPDWPGWEQPAR